MARMHRIAIRVEEKIRKRINQGAAKEGLPPAEFCRRVFEWSCDQYFRIGELAALRQTQVTSEKQKADRKGKETK
jgi:hypothetical protein